MTGRRMICGTVAFYVVLLARPLSYLLLLLRLDQLRDEMPEMFDGPAALAAIGLVLGEEAM